MNVGLSEDQQAYVALAREFATRELKPNAAAWDATGEFPKPVFKRAGDVGLMGLYTPAEVGGLGLSRLDAAMIFEELANGCTSTAAFMTIHNMALWMIASFGGDAVRDRFCEKLIAGEWLASYCLTEPQSGSDAASLRTAARRDGDRYRLTGQKVFISGAGATDVLVVMARVDDKPGAGGISAFAVRADAPGVSFGKKEEKLGWRNQPTRAIHFDDVEVPAEQRFGSEGDGFKIAMKGLDGGRINIATCAVGTAQAALTSALGYVQERKQFGQRLAEFQSVQFKVADMATELVAARQMVRMAAAYLDAKHPEATAYCAMAKRFATDVSFNVCNEALQLHGGYGYLQDFPLERHLRDVRVHQILEGTNEIMRVIIARRLLLDSANEVLR